MNTSVPDALPQSRPTWPRLRRFAIDAAITSAFNLLIALLVTYVLRLHPVFLDNLLISMCIGLLMMGIIDGGRLLLWGLEKPPALPFALLFAISLPTALLLGQGLAAILLGMPADQILQTQVDRGPGYAMLLLLIAVAITWFFWSRGHLAMLKAEAEAEKARAAAIERQALQAQLQALQAQIEPHMLFNTLANLQGLIALDPPRAQHMLEHLIRYLRATLSASRSGSTTLKQEFALLDAYLGLMQVRMGTRLAYALHLPDDLDDVQVPPLLLQPLVENAIKHGLEPKVDGGRIDVRAWREGGMLHLSVADTGLGLAPEHAGAGAEGGVGLTNIRERLLAKYGPRSALRLESAPAGGTTATLSLPT